MKNWTGSIGNRMCGLAVRFAFLMYQIRYNYEIICKRFWIASESLLKKTKIYMYILNIISAQITIVFVLNLKEKPNQNNRKTYNTYLK